MSQQKLNMLISGRVQGVGYRASTVDKALSLGLTGYARNLSDGGVEVVAEGAAESLMSLKQWCGDGPPAAVVDDIQATTGTATGEFTDFEVR
jgi:acylphosphatase